MKIKKIIIVLNFLLLISCVKDEDRSFEGFTFVISNETNLIYDAEIFIGAIKNGVFSPTDSIVIPKIKVGKGHPHYFIDEHRWRPNLESIRNIPANECYFLLKLSNSREEILKRYDTSTLFGLEISNNKKIVDEEGRIYIYIYDNEIFGENQ
ncbi:hypothetical protein [Polaribacter gochangensis]|uniref:hypothetical protein n=1 Tax=Polaribacter gochangensis TaxID=3252903 RepID=UPI003904D648